MTSDYVARFWSKVTIGAPDECWLWGAGSYLPTKRHKTRYGLFWDGEKVLQAHRYSYRISKGPISPGLLIRHSCDNGLCVNPGHLDVGNAQQNMQDAIDRGRVNWLSGEDHPSSTIAEWQAAQIKGLLLQPIKRRAIANKFGISLNLIGFIARGQCWAAVETVMIDFKNANVAMEASE